MIPSKSFRFSRNCMLLRPRTWSCLPDCSTWEVSANGCWTLLNINRWSEQQVNNVMHVWAPGCLIMGSRADGGSIILIVRGKKHIGDKMIFIRTHSFLVSWCFTDGLPRYGMWRGKAYRLIGERKQKVSEESKRLGVSLSFALDELESGQAWISACCSGVRHILQHVLPLDPDRTFQKCLGVWVVKSFPAESASQPLQQSIDGISQPTKISGGTSQPTKNLAAESASQQK